MNQQAPVIIAGFIIAAILVGGGVLWYRQHTTTPPPVERSISGTVIPPTKTDCADELDTTCWNTYVNEEHGFELKLAKIFEIDNRQESTFLVYGRNDYYFSIFNVENLNVKDGISRLEARDILGYENVYAIENINLNGQAGAIISGSGSGAYPQGDIIIYFFPNMGGQGKNVAFKLGSIIGGVLDPNIVDKFKKSLESLIL